jgi:hypothetical protein
MPSGQRRAQAGRLARPWLRRLTFMGFLHAPRALAIMTALQAQVA